MNMNTRIMREDAAIHVNNTLPLIYWTACHQRGIREVNQAILDTQGRVVRDWPHAQEMLQQGREVDVFLTDYELRSAYAYAAATLLFCIQHDNAIMGPLRTADVWHMEMTGHGERSVSQIPERDLKRMSTSRHTLNVTVPLATGRIGRLDPEPAVVMTSQPTNALIRVDMSLLSDRHDVSEALFLVESQHKARHDLYVAQGTFLVALYRDDRKTERAWQRWVPNVAFFYQTMLVQCGRQVVTVNAKRESTKQRGAAALLPPQFIETPHTLGPVAV